MNALVMPPGFVVGREAELDSELQAGVWIKEDVPSLHVFLFP